MRLAAAELVESREILPGQWLQAYHAPDVASGSRAGQFIHVRPGDFSGMILRRPFSLNTADSATGIITIHFRVIGRGTEWFTRLRQGDKIDLLGPLGRPFEVDPRSRHLLLVAGGLGIAGVRMLVDEAIRDGRQVTLLFGAASAREVYPSNLLPDEVEYIVATDDGSLGHHGYVTDLVIEYEAWADQAFACGPAPMLAATARLATGRRERLGVAKLGRKRGMPDEICCEVRPVVARAFRVGRAEVPIRRSHQDWDEQQRQGQRANVSRRDFGQCDERRLDAPCDRGADEHLDQPHPDKREPARMVNRNGHPQRQLGDPITKHAADDPTRRMIGAHEAPAQHDAWRDGGRVDRAVQQPGHSDGGDKRHGETEGGEHERS